MPIFPNFLALLNNGELQSGSFQAIVHVAIPSQWMQEETGLLVMLFPTGSTHHAPDEQHVQRDIIFFHLQTVLRNDPHCTLLASMKQVTRKASNVARQQNFLMD